MTGSPDDLIGRTVDDGPGESRPDQPAPFPEPRQRLHPLSPLLHGAKTLAVIIAALSWQGLSQLGLGWFAALVVIFLSGSVVWSVVAWYFTGYHIVGRELRIYEGLLWRRIRAIPLERLQAVDVVRPLLAQLTGLAELRLEVMGGGKAEAPLAYLSVAGAVALRDRLLALAGLAGAPGAAPGPARAATGPATTARGPTAGGESVGAGAVEPSAAAPGGPGRGAMPPGRLLHAVANRDLVASQLLTPQAFLVPVGAAFVVAQFALEGSWGFITLASTVTALAGVLLQPVRRVLRDWDFRLARDDSSLRIGYGLVESRHQTVPLHRVQAVELTWPLLWRINDWLRMRLDVAGYAAPEQQNASASDRLLPVGNPPTARRLVWEVLAGVDLAALRLRPPPARARWRHPVGWRSLATGNTDRVLAVHHGVLTRHLVLVPYARIQSVRVVQGPVQRWLRLATVHADTAGGSGAAARDRDVREAWALAAELADRARVARITAGGGTTHRNPTARTQERPS